MTRVLVIAIIAVGLHTPAAAQDPWRDFASNLAIGSTLKVHLTDGRQFEAVLVAVETQALLLQPRTRQPVPVQPLPYSAIASLEPVKHPGGGLSLARAVAIGAGALSPSRARQLLVPAFPRRRGCGLQSGPLGLPVRVPCPAPWPADRRRI